MDVSASGNSSSQEQVAERDQHVARLQDALRHEREKCSRLQLRCNQQGAELKRREQQNNRWKERLSQLTEKQKEKGSTMELLNPLSKGQWQKDPTGRPNRPNGRQEEAALCVMLERREAELREAMKLRHCLTTMLHALRANMERALDSLDDQEEIHNRSAKLAQSESELGDHVTGAVVQGWVRVQKKLGELLALDNVAVGTDQDKLLAQLETELEQSQQLVRLQQQLLQDSAVCAIPSALVDSYYLEEWEQLQARCAELECQKRSFQRERQAFTDAAIRLGHEISQPQVM
ncbi:afadin- and alpha-actinin-binding protein [Aplochiton taeniatus]